MIYRELTPEEHERLVNAIAATTALRDEPDSLAAVCQVIGSDHTLWQLIFGQHELISILIEIVAQQWGKTPDQILTELGCHFAVPTDRNDTE